MINNINLIIDFSLTLTLLLCIASVANKAN